LWIRRVALSVSSSLPSFPGLVLVPRPHAHTPTSAAKRKFTGPGKNRGDEEGGREDAPADERCENIERLGAQTATIIGRYNAMEYLIGVHIFALDVLLVAIGWSIVGWIVQATF